MFGNEEMTVAIALCSVLIVLPIQLLLCFKCKSLILRLSPSILFLFSTVFLLVMSSLTKDWDALGYVLLSVYSGVLLVFDAVAWGVYAIIRLVKKDRPGK